MNAYDFRRKDAKTIRSHMMSDGRIRKHYEFIRFLTEGCKNHMNSYDLRRKGAKTKQIHMISDGRMPKRFEHMISDLRMHKLY